MLVSQYGSLEVAAMAYSLKLTSFFEQICSVAEAVVALISYWLAGGHCYLLPAVMSCTVGGTPAAVEV